jgi:5'-nucleotidase
MTIPARAVRYFWLAAVAAGLLLSGCATQPVSGESPPLRILLTNDDGYDAPGIEALQTALLAAGHEVTVVAPRRDHSGSGAQVTTRGSLGLREHAPNFWSVDGSPADAVLVGLFHIMQDEWPDLVVAGANFGQNLGYAINSGTVGAATVAMYAGVPAIALSVGVDLSEAGAKPYPYPSTFKAFPRAGELCARIIRDLQDAQPPAGRLLPEHTLINVNYPVTRSGKIQGVRVLPAARSAGVYFEYEEAAAAGQVDVKVRIIDPETADSDGADWHMFARGYVTISVLDGDWDAGEPLREEVARRLSDTTARWP